MLIILELEIDLVAVDAAVSIDLINCDLCAVLNCETIYGSCTCNRADTTDLEYFTGICCALSGSGCSCCCFCCGRRASTCC